MPLVTIFKDSPEYENRKRTPFRPPKVCIPFPRYIACFPIVLRSLWQISAPPSLSTSIKSLLWKAAITLFAIFCSPSYSTTWRRGLKSWPILSSRSCHLVPWTQPSSKLWLLLFNGVVGAFISTGRVLPLLVFGAWAMKQDTGLYPLILGSTQSLALFYTL